MPALGVAAESSPVIELLGTSPKLDAVAAGRTVPIAAVSVAPRTRVASPLAAQLGCAFGSGPLGEFIQDDEGRLTGVAGVWAAADAAVRLR